MRGHETIPHKGPHKRKQKAENDLPRRKKFTDPTGHWSASHLHPQLFRDHFEVQEVVEPGQDPPGTDSDLPRRCCPNRGEGFLLASSLEAVVSHLERLGSTGSIMLPHNFEASSLNACRGWEGKSDDRVLLV